jgi:hypothetical protein
MDEVGESSLALWPTFAAGVSDTDLDDYEIGRRGAAEA